MTIDAAYTRWADSYDTDPNATRDLDWSATTELLGPLRVGMSISRMRHRQEHAAAGRYQPIRIGAGLLARHAGQCAGSGS